MLTNQERRQTRMDLIASRSLLFSPRSHRKASARAEQRGAQRRPGRGNFIDLEMPNGSTRAAEATSRPVKWPRRTVNKLKNARPRKQYHPRPLN